MTVAEVKAMLFEDITTHNNSIYAKPMGMMKNVSDKLHVN